MWSTTHALQGGDVERVARFRSGALRRSADWSVGYTTCHAARIKTPCSNPEIKSKNHSRFERHLQLRCPFGPRDGQSTCRCAHAHAYCLAHIARAYRFIVVVYSIARIDRHRSRSGRFARVYHVADTCIALQVAYTYVQVPVDRFPSNAVMNVWDTSSNVR